MEETKVEYPRYVKITKKQLDTMTLADIEDMVNKEISERLEAFYPSETIRPSYYGDEEFDLIELMYRIDSAMCLAFCAGNVAKYALRYNQKDGLKDLRKANTYLQRIIKYKSNMPTEIAKEL